MNARTFLPAVAIAALAFGFATSAADAASAARSLAWSNVQISSQMTADIRDDQTNLARTNVGSLVPDDNR